MFSKSDDKSGFVELLKGISLKTISYGEKTLTAKFHLKKDSLLPLHRHPHEQTGYLLAGRMEFEIDGEKSIAEPGDSWTIEGNIQHGARVLEDSVAIEVFCPVRADYLPANLERRAEIKE